MLNFIGDLLKYFQVFVFRDLILHFKYYQNPETTPPTFPLYFAASLFIAIKIGKTFFHHQSQFFEQVLGVKTVNQVTALIYDKVTKSSVFIKNQISEGEILNNIQVDANSLNVLFTSLPKIINAPINFIITLYLLFKMFGNSLWFGMAVLFFLILIIWCIQTSYLVNAYEMLNRKDARMRLITHTFHIIKVLKLFGWEEEFKNNIDTKRNFELEKISTLFNLIAFRNFINSNIPILISLASIGGYTYLYGAMEISILFSSIELVEQIATPLIEIPGFLTNMYASMISTERIKKFLLVKDIESISNQDPSQKDISIKFTNCNFGIGDVDNTGENKVLLNNLNIQIKQGE